jgi:WS/DGAT/MGAT family acyltransferase
MVDGVAGADLLAVVLDTEPDPEPCVAPPWQPLPAPSDVELAARAIVDMATRPYEQFRAARALMRTPRRAVSRGVDLLQGFREMARVARPLAPSSLNGPIGPHRRWTWARASLADVKDVRRAFGGTVNDVVLTAVTGGFRDLLLKRGEPVDDRVVRTLVPVSVRAADARGVLDNRVAAMFADLPVGIDDPLACLATLHDQLVELKESHEADAVEALSGLSEWSPPTLLAAAERFVARFQQRNVNTVTTNVPGPPFPLYLVGKRMLEIFPFVPLAAGLRVGVAIFSYDGTINFGVTGDWDTAEDVDVLAAGIERSLGEMLDMARNEIPVET